MKIKIVDSYSSNRKLKYISDVELPDYLQELSDIEDKLFSLNSETFDSFHQQLKKYIRDNADLSDYFQNLIHNAINLRPKSILNYCRLYFSFFKYLPPNCSFLLTSYQEVMRGHGSALFPTLESIEQIFETDSLGLYLKEDDVDGLQKLASSEDFNYNDEVSTFPIQILNFDMSVRLIDIASAFGSINCFKFLQMNKAVITGNTFDAAIMGGNLEIIKIIDASYEEVHSISIETAIRYHRYDIVDWLLDNVEVQRVKPFNSLFIGHTKAFVFAAVNFKKTKIYKKDKLMKKLLNPLFIRYAAEQKYIICDQINDKIMKK